MNQEQRKQYLQETHTRLLLEYLSHSRSKCVGWFSPFDNSVGFTTTEIKEELSTREHIPNKREAKLIRQQKQFNKQKR